MLLLLRLLYCRPVLRIRSRSLAPMASNHLASITAIMSATGTRQSASKKTRNASIPTHAFRVGSFVKTNSTARFLSMTTWFRSTTFWWTKQTDIVGAFSTPRHWTMHKAVDSNSLTRNAHKTDSHLTCAACLSARPLRLEGRQQRPRQT